MSLEYSGIPNFSKERELKLQSITLNKLDQFASSTPKKPRPEDSTFDEINKLYIKGETLKKAIGDINPAGFIPVESESAVISSLQRLSISSPYNIITFGLFKKACEHISSRGQAFNEDYILKFNAIDPVLASTSTTTTYKNISNNGNDWITAFLEMLSPIAGIMIAGKMVQFHSAITPEQGTDQYGGTGEKRTEGLIALPAAIALIIELGLTADAFKKLYKQNDFPSDIFSTYEDLMSNPSKRAEALNAAGYDYEALRTNQTFDDYKKVKEYCINYIQSNREDLSYSHWISYSMAVDGQQIVRPAAAMAPLYSNKWKQFYDTGFINEKDITTDITEENTTEDFLKDAAIFSFNAGIAGYLGQLYVNMNNMYNSMYQHLTYTIDPKIICCLVWYMGPINVDFLKSISSMLSIAGLEINTRMPRIDNITEAANIIMMNMVSTYMNIILDRILMTLVNKLYSVDLGILNQSIFLCPGVGIIIELASIALDFVLNILNEIFNHLRMSTNRIQAKADLFHVAISDSKGFLTIKKMIDSIIMQVENVNGICNTETDKTTIIDNQTIADKTLDFVTFELDKLYPVLVLSEPNRRKHFINIPPVSSKMKIEVPGFDRNGNSYTENQFTPDCGADNSATKGIILGKSIADTLKGN